MATLNVDTLFPKLWLLGCQAIAGLDCRVSTQMEQVLQYRRLTRLGSLANHRPTSAGLHVHQLRGAFQVGGHFDPVVVFRLGLRFLLIAERLRSTLRLSHKCGPPFPLAGPVEKMVLVFLCEHHSCRAHRSGFHIRSSSHWFR